MSDIRDPRVYFAAERTLQPAQIPEGYRVNAGAMANVLVALLGVALCVYLFLESAS